MNKKDGLVMAGIGVSAFAVLLAAAACYLLNGFSVSYECQIEFLYEDRALEMACDSFGDSSCDGNTMRIKNRSRLVLSEFNSEYGAFSTDEMVRRCRTEASLRDESEQRSKAVLSSRKIEVVEGLCTNSVYGYRIRLEDSREQNLGEYARLCIKVIKDQMDRESEIRADKAVFYENQQMRKAEQRIKELAKSISKCDTSQASETELQRAKDTVRETGRRIEEIRSKVLSRNSRRIIYESKPKVSWVVRGEPKNGNSE